MLWPTYVQYILLHKVNPLAEFRTLDSSLIPSWIWDTAAGISGKLFYFMCSFCSEVQVCLKKCFWGWVFHLKFFVYVAKSIKNCQNVGFVRCAFTIRCICVMHYQICGLVYLFLNQIVVSLNRNSPGSVDLFTCSHKNWLKAQLQKQESWTLCGELLFQIALSKVKNKSSSFNFTSLWLFSSDSVQLLVFRQYSTFENLFCSVGEKTVLLKTAVLYIPLLSGPKCRCWP